MTLVYASPWPKYMYELWRKCSRAAWTVSSLRIPNYLYRPMILVVIKIDGGGGGANLEKDNCCTLKWIPKLHIQISGERTDGGAAARVMCLCFDIAVLRVTMKSH